MRPAQVCAGRSVETIVAPLPFDRSFEGAPGEPVRLSPLVRRVLAPNPGPFTFLGTDTYLVGERELAVIDPGPDDPAHLAALLAAIGRATVTAILVTHTHRDHSPGAAALQRAMGAPTYGEGPHRPARPLQLGEIGRLDAGGDTAFVPDRALREGDRVSGEGWTLETVATPGHAANHLAFALAEEQTLFCGDHVMAWSTSIVAPPDGAMADYMASLDKLIGRTDRALYPGHGAAIRDVPERLAWLKEHRLERERQILDRLALGDETIPDMVRAIYADVDRRLHGAAALSVYAHLEDLVARGFVRSDGPPSLESRYRLGS